MSWSTVSAELATILGSVTGIKKAFDVFVDAPNAIHDSYLPCVIPYPAETAATGGTAGTVHTDRIWRVPLYIASVERPVDLAKKAALAQPFIIRIYDALADASQLDDLASIDLAEIEGDTGLAVIEYGGVAYVGVEFRLRVVEEYAATVST